MQSTLRLKATVLLGHRLEVHSPELPEGATVEVIVVLPAAAPAQRSMFDCRATGESADMPRRPDTIRAAIVAKAEALGLTAYAVAKRTETIGVGRPITDDALKLYFNGKTALSSDRLDAVFAVLGLSVAHV